jgi:hypothetical protein
MEEIGEFLARREAGPDAGEPDKAETLATVVPVEQLASAAPVEQYDSLAMDGGHKDAAPEDAR